MHNSNTNRQILTTPAYWNSISESTKGYWQSTANVLRAVTVCTNRPSLNEHGKGGLHLRRCSTGGKWSKSADNVWINSESLLKAGYIYVTYESKGQRAAKVAAKREAVYANDNH